MTSCTVSHWDQRQRRRALQAWILRSSTGAFAAQAFLVYYLKEIGANDQLLGWAFAIPTFATAAQFAGAYWAERTPSRRRICIRFFEAQAYCWLVILALGAWWAGQPDRYPTLRLAIVLLTSVAALFAHLQNPAWDSWFSDAVEDQHKSGFFGQWGLWTNTIACVVSLGGGLLVQVVAAGQSSRVFQWMMLLLFAGNVACLWSAARMYRHLVDVPGHRPERGFRDLIRIALDQRNYMLFLLMYAARILAISVYGAFAYSWFKDDLKMGIFYLGALTALNQVLTAVASPFWSVVVKKFGGKPAIWLGTLVSALHPLVYFAYTPTNYRWLALLHWGAVGFLLSSYSVAVNTLWYRLPSKHARSMQFALAWTAFGIAGAVGVALGGWVATQAPALTLGPWQWSHYHWLFAFGIVLHAPCFLLLHRLQEEGSYSPRIMATWLLRRARSRIG